MPISPSLTTVLRYCREGPSEEDLWQTKNLPVLLKASFQENRRLQVYGRQNALALQSLLNPGVGWTLI